MNDYEKLSSDLKKLEELEIWIRDEVKASMPKVKFTIKERLKMIWWKFMIWLIRRLYE